jgi:hypothetical protein
MHWMQRQSAASLIKMNDVCRMSAYNQLFVDCTRCRGGAMVLCFCLLLLLLSHAGLNRSMPCSDVYRWV